jgi:hypothetical protein
MDPNEDVHDRYNELDTADEQQLDASFLSKHHVPITPDTVT